MVLQQIILFGAFIFALGACVGSFLNVVIWRLPYRGREVIYGEKRGPLTLSWPPSHCPVCDAGIRWYQNIPVISWIALKAKCANCRTGIPFRYPLVELGTALLFTAFFLAYFVGHWQAARFTDIRDWRQAAAFAVCLIFIASLLAASAIDADLYIIPLSIPWFLVAVGLVAAITINHPAIPALTGGYFAALAKPTLGATGGLILANILLALKWLPRSFSQQFLELARIDAKKKAADNFQTPTKKERKQSEEGKSEPHEEPMAAVPKLTRFGPWAAAVVVLIILAAASWAAFSRATATLIDVVIAIIIFFIGVLPRDAGQVDLTDEVLEEVSMPHVRGEVLKEALFFMVPVVCAIIAYFIPGELPSAAWFSRVLGCLVGVLAGGGLVWVVRIGGTLGFNKEAMGLGDVHLMAGVGAIIGAPLAIVAFFLGPFVAIFWIIILKMLRRPNVLPYGPWLSVASILSLFVGPPILQFYFPGAF